MNNLWLALGLSIVLPALPLANSVFLLKRAVRPGTTHWLSLAASATVFGFSSLWLMNSALKLIAAWRGDMGEALLRWQYLNLAAGPFFSFSLLLLSGGFWARLAWTQRRSASK